MTRGGAAVHDKHAFVHAVHILSVRPSVYQSDQTGPDCLLVLPSAHLGWTGFVILICSSGLLVQVVHPPIRAGSDFIWAASAPSAHQGRIGVGHLGNGRVQSDDEGSEDEGSDDEGSGDGGSDWSPSPPGALLTGVF